MKHLIAAAASLLALAGPAAAGAPTVAVKSGEVIYTDAAGAARPLTSGGYSDAALSPDGKTVALIHTDGPPAPAGGAGDDPPTSLWVVGVDGGAPRKVIGSHTADDVKQLFVSYGGPLFSLDGGFVYVTADAWATSGAVHEVNLATGQEHFVIDGGAGALIRTGPYRGYLLVSRHMYHPAPEYGAYDPTYVVRPDGKVILMVPGTDKDDNTDHLNPWLAAKGWKAW